MESYLAPPSTGHFDLVTPDGCITQILSRTSQSLEAAVTIENISPAFAGFTLSPDKLLFNIKSTIAQLDTDGIGHDISLDKQTRRASLIVTLKAIGPLGEQFLPYIEEGCYIGKLFAPAKERRVRNPDYLLRMFGRLDREGLPLLFLEEEKSLRFEKVDGRLVAFLPLKNGVLEYDEKISGFLPTLGKALKCPKLKTRDFLPLHQKWVDQATKKTNGREVLLVRTSPLHIRTAFARVVDELLPKGLRHTSASVLQPDTKASGDIYELYGHSEEEITEIPLEFYTLEPHREHVFFTDRDQLQTSLEDSATIFKTFETAPKDRKKRAAIFVVKGEQLLKLKEKDWITRTVHQEGFPGLIDLNQQAQMVRSYINQQPSTPFLRAIETGLITSQGVLFTRYFPSPLMKKMLLGDYVQSSLKGIYFETPSQSHGNYFSHEDRSMLLDLAKFAIPVFWADRTCGKVLQFAPKPEKDTGMFVPIKKVDEFVHSTSFGVYGSTLVELEFEEELSALLEGVLEMRPHTAHPLLDKDTPLALITGGGPGVMETGNRVARKLDILSCANVVDFSGVEQEQNPYIEAKMTFRLDRLVERQGEFNLDFPIFLMGGFGTDFEFALERVRRKVEVGPPTPVLLLGKPSYWEKKITLPFQTNLESGTIANAEWVSNCFYAVETAEQGLAIYRDFFEGKLAIGPNAPLAPKGFFIP